MNQYAEQTDTLPVVTVEALQNWLIDNPRDWATLELDRSEVVELVALLERDAAVVTRQSVALEEEGGPG